jgi:polyribonucleotide nucleotidyltransferase
MSGTYELEVGGKQVTLQTGQLAQQANGSVVVRCGDTVVLVTATMASSAREGVDFLPLTVDYEERLYAAGRIPGSFFRREGRPSQEGILTCRLTDRPLRPRFPKGFRNEIQVISTVLSVDQVNPPDILSIIGASAALSISNIPFDGPIAASRVGYVDGDFVINPTFEELSRSRLDLVVAGSRDAVIMVEAGASGLTEEQALEAVQVGQEANLQVIALQDQMAKELGVAKFDWSPPIPPNEELDRRVTELAENGVAGIIDRGEGKGERNAATVALEKELIASLGEEYGAPAVAKAFDGVVKKVVRSKILKEGKRPDGRKVEEIRPISCAVGILPRTHGTGLFQRGQTQVLTVATLGPLALEQRLDTLSPEDTKRYMHHYNFPPYSTGEVRRVGSPGRREIGHGALAERALLPVLPDETEFPYALRLVSEALSSNGSTSMASVCGSSMALMDAGVPITAPVAGVAMGLILGDGDEFAVLTDIQGIEDFMGDMDFKVAGTADGITALQMDIKGSGIAPGIMKQALDQAHKARMVILGHMHEAIAEPRSELNPYAPRMIRISIPVDKIGAVIGPGGKTIRSIVEETGATVDVANDGTVTIGTSDGDASRKAIAMVEGLTKDTEVGEIFTGKVTRIMSFGAFAEIMPGKEGLIRVSELSETWVENVEDVVKVGDEISVMVTEVDRMGRINLSHRAVLEGKDPEDLRRENGARQDRPDGDRRPGGSGGPRPGFRDRGGSRGGPR